MKMMFNFSRKKIGIIGFGNMGQAIAERISSKYAVQVFEKDAAKTKSLAGITAASDIAQLLKQNQVIILAIKPQDFEPVLAEIKEHLGDQLIVSIAAGVTTEYIQKVLGNVRVVRVMPNLAVKVGKSVTSVCKGVIATRADLKFVERLFKYLGTVFIFPEEMMDAVTAIAGSGPGFFFALAQGRSKVSLREFAVNIFQQDLIGAAENVGFNHGQATILAQATTASSLSLLESSNLSALELCAQVTSKGGTTQAGLEILKGDEKNLKLAVQAAKKRAEELTKKE